MTTIAVVTNARAADQRSMIGYGDLVLAAAAASGARVVEWRAASVFAKLPVRGRLRKLALNLDRFVVTPLAFTGRKADIVHVVDPGNCIYLPLTRHCWSIVTVHDMIPFLARDGELPGFRPTRTGLWLMQAIVARLKRVDEVVCVSEASRRDVARYVGIPADRIRVMYNAVFQSMEPATAAACTDFRARAGLPGKAPLILHVGRNFYKNREMVLDVFARVRAVRSDVKLVMVGALSPALQAQAESLGVAPDLHILPQVDRDDMAKLYSTAAVLFFPSVYEGFGLPVLEAHMCGTPVVCSNAASLAEVAERFGRFFDGTVQDATRLVLRALEQCRPEDVDKRTAGDIGNMPDADGWRDALLRLYADGIRELGSGG